MYKGSFLELKDKIIVIAVVLVLEDSAPPRLAGHRVLQFRCGDGDTIEAQDKVEGVVVLVTVFSWRVTVSRLAA